MISEALKNVIETIDAELVDGNGVYFSPEEAEALVQALRGINAEVFNMERAVVPAAVRLPEPARLRIEGNVVHVPFRGDAA